MFFENSLRAAIFNQNADKLENYVEAANLMYILGQNIYGVSVYLNESGNGATP